MARRNWKRLQANSIPHAMELCLQYGRETQNLSVERIADLMGEASHFTLYKWLESGRMPAIKIRPYEHACGIDFVTRYLAHSNNKLILPMPSGRKAEHRELVKLNVAANETLGMILKFQDGEQTAEETVTAITVLMEDLAHQRGNVEKHRQPDLGLADEGIRS